MTPKEIEVETMMYSRTIETAKNAIKAASPVGLVHLKKYCRNPVVCLVVKSCSHHD
jgi:hypothetical protein